MKKMNMKTLYRNGKIAGSKTGGFSLIELVVALACFLIISAGAITLVQAHTPLATTVQNQVGLNIALGNVVAQLQNDVMNAGYGYYNQLNNVDSPVGITIINCGNETTGCNSSTGNDTLNIIAMDPTTPAGLPTNAAGNTPATPNTACFDTSTISSGSNSTIYMYPLMSPPSAAPTSAAASALAAKYNKGDYILLVHTTTGGNQFTTAQLTANGAVSSTSNTMVTLTVTATAAGGASQTFGISSGTWSADPFYITKDTNTIPGTTTPRLTDTFCYGTDSVMRMGTMITYSVDGSQNLLRNGVVIAPQILSFKVGAMAYNTGSSNDQSAYVFNAPASTPSQGCTPTATLDCGFNNDWPLIRSVMVSVVGHTPANITNSFRNTYDSGAYQVQAVTTILNPRNLGMRDNISTMAN